MEQPQIPSPASLDPDVFGEYLGWVRRTHEGTDYPGVLAVVSNAVTTLREHGVTGRELRIFAARCTTVLEGFDDEAHLAQHEIRAAFLAVTGR